jgi:hypothetical protein
MHIARRLGVYACFCLVQPAEGNIVTMNKRHTIRNLFILFSLLDILRTVPVWLKGMTRQKN